MPDLILKCADCKDEFTFTEKDQKFFAEKGYQAPKRCKACRIMKKAARAADGGGSSGERGTGERDQNRDVKPWSNR